MNGTHPRASLMFYHSSSWRTTCAKRHYPKVSVYDLVNSIPDPEVAPKESFSTVFGNVLNKEGAENQKICAITAAMKYGTGLQFFAHTHPKRFFDVGIGERRGKV